MFETEVIGMGLKARDPYEKFFRQNQFKNAVQVNAFKKLEISKNVQSNFLLNSATETISNY